MINVGMSIHAAPIASFGPVSPVEKAVRRSAPLLTLFDLVDAVSESCESEIEVIATVRHLLSTGRVRLQACEQPR